MANYAPEAKRGTGRNDVANSSYTGLLSDGTRFTGKTWLEDKYYNFYTTADLLTMCNGDVCLSYALEALEM